MGSVHAVATPDAHRGDIECVFVAAPRYPGERADRFAACSRAPVLVAAVESADGFDEGVDEDPNRAGTKRTIPRLSAATQPSTIMTTDGLRLTAAVSTRVPEDAEPGVWNSVVAWSPSGFACDEAVATIGEAVSFEVGAVSS